jgi:hypothetical protein
MLQPFLPLKSIYLKRLVSLGKRYLVVQSYARAFNPLSQDKRQGLVVTDYDSIGQAKIHLNAIKTDQYAAILYLDNETHSRKINELISPGSDFQVFWGVVFKADELQKKLTLGYKEHIKRYISTNTNWKISRDIGVQPKFKIIYAELFIILKYGNETLQIKFLEIEKA